MWRVIRVLIQARIPDTRKMFVIRLEFHGIFGEWMLSILNGEGVLKDVDQRFLAR